MIPVELVKAYLDLGVISPEADEVDIFFSEEYVWKDPLVEKYYDPALGLSSAGVVKMISMLTPAERKIVRERVVAKVRADNWGMIGVKP